MVTGHRNVQLLSENMPVAALRWVRQSILCVMLLIIGSFAGGAAQASVASLPALNAFVLPSVAQPSFPGASDTIPTVTLGRGNKGLAYDLDSVDEKVKRRLITNRLSAERLRLRKNALMVDTLIGRIDQLRTENAALHKRLAAFEAMALQHGLHLP